MNESQRALVSPYLIAISDLAQEAETGADVSLRLQGVVADALDDFGQVYKSEALVASLVQSLETNGQAAKLDRPEYASVLLRAAAIAERATR